MDYFSGLKLSTWDGSLFISRGTGYFFSQTGGAITISATDFVCFKAYGIDALVSGLYSLLMNPWRNLR